MNRKERREIGGRGPQHPTVEVAYIHPGSTSAVFTDSLIRCRDYELVRTHQLVGVRSKRSRSGRIAESRNLLTAAFMQSRSDVLVFIDADMGFPRTTIHQLLAASSTERPIMGALCFGQRTEGFDEETNAELFGTTPTLLDWQYADDGTVIGWQTIEDYPRDTVCRVKSTGAACVLLHRMVLERMSERHGPNWWTPIWLPTTGEFFTEDTSFYLRAHELDVPVHVHTGVRTSHDKGGVYLTEQTWDAQQRLREFTSV